MDFSTLSVKSVDKLPVTNGKYVRDSSKPRQAPMQGPKRARAPRMITKPFIGWDGEGYNPSDGSAHKYILFGSSIEGYSIQSEHGETLRTIDCFTLMLKCAHSYPNAYHVGFAFSYDVEMMTVDISAGKMRELYDTGTVVWGPFRINYIPRKWFSVSAKPPGFKKRVVCRIWDIFSFFTTTFIQAIEQYLGKDAEGFQTVASGKSQRSNFQFDELETLIKPYWEIEQKLLVQLMDHFRSLLISAGLPIKSWHGPGAIASYLMRTHGIKQHQLRPVPYQISYMSQRAFAGGRFELFKIGRAHRKVYTYDINSAYPAAIANLPSLTGEWHRSKELCKYSQFGVYRIRYHSAHPRDSITHYREPQPFFHRNPDGSIVFPPVNECWVWTPELLAARKTGHDFTILDGWECEDDGTRPFAWVAEMYDKRQEWKEAGNQAQFALKLGINSLYGKTAQRVGWENAPDNVPMWHQLEWAGYITSSARAKLWEALWPSYRYGALIATETDSVISLVELDLPISNKLGEWSYNVCDDIVYLQNGIYMSLVNGKWIWHYRGFDKGSLGIQSTLDFLDNEDMSDSFRPVRFTGQTTRFIGGRTALRGRIEKWRTWETADLTILIGIHGKRGHEPDLCIACSRGYTMLGTDNAMHEQCVTPSDYVTWPPSHPHVLPWLDNENEETYTNDEKFHVDMEGELE